ncbi:MAG: HEAT repeat domain-containing protein [Bacteroidota bacterium]|nr:HEAT repeat domain-containing protein [Bacteroidota bacterium]
MNHKHIKELLPIFLYGDLSPDETAEVRQHLETCTECRGELESLKAFNAVLSGLPAVEVTGELLNEARQELRAALRRETVKQSLWERVAERAGKIFAPRYRFAFSAAAMLLAGVGIGYAIFYRTGFEQTKQNGMPLVSETSQNSRQSVNGGFLRGGTRTDNLHFLNLDPQSGEVEFTFDAVTPMRVKGNVNDEQVQKVMAHAIVNSDNPGVRLKTVSALAEQGEQLRDADPAVKSALITALKTDGNPGVRSEALRALMQMPFDKEIKEAVLFVLLHDKNSGMRVAAINSLELTSHEKRMSDADILRALKKKVQSDDTNYVRLQARTVLQEVSQ